MVLKSFEIPQPDVQANTGLTIIETSLPLFLHRVLIKCTLISTAGASYVKILGTLVMTSLTAHLRKLFGNRRTSPRYQVEHEAHLITGVTVFDAENQPRSFVGHTRNISKSGLSIILSSISADDFIISEGEKLTLLIVLPTRRIKLTATTVYCKLLSEEKPAGGYMIGAQIVKMSDTDRRYYVEYLKTLK